MRCRAAGAFPDVPCREDPKENEMSRMNPIDPAIATGKARELLDAVKSKLGVVPNMMRTMANSPAVLEAYLNFMAALAKGSLNAAQREGIAIAVAQANQCQYCLSAHAFLGPKAGMKDIDVAAARTAESSDPRTSAILRLAGAVNGREGHISDDDLTAARSAGLSEGDIAETVANVGLNVFTNWFNHVTDPVVDFPVLQL